MKEADAFFAELLGRLNDAVSENIREISKLEPKERIVEDWKALKGVLGEEFSKLVEKFDGEISDIANACTVPDMVQIEFLPAGVDDRFQEKAANVLAELLAAKKAFQILQWSKEHFEKIETAIENLIFDDGSTNKNSLRAILSRGKEGADVRNELKQAHIQLQQIYARRQNIAKLEADVADLDKIEGPLGTLKDLKGYAEAEVERIFLDVSDDTVEIWKELYPDTPANLAPGGLVKKGRDIEATLAGEDFRAQAKLFANSGLQRAIALAFYFALLKQHPGGLGFALLDDAIISLDEDHRERWSANVLRPCMDHIQIVFATHQQDYLKNCYPHFDDGKITELNRRNTEGWISKKPRDGIAQAKKILQVDYKAVPNILRQFCENTLDTLSSYSSEIFYKQDDLNKSIERYSKLPNSNPVARGQHKRISDVLQSQQVASVIHAGSHGATSPQVTQPMVQDCYAALQSIDGAVKGEIRRLDRLSRQDKLSRTIAPLGTAEFPQVPLAANWNEPLELKIIGSAGANPESVVFDTTAEPRKISVADGSAVRVCGDTIDPVAKIGQWVILAKEDVSVGDGNLAAVELHDGRKLLRRAWSDEEVWRLQTVNPVETRRVESVRKDESAIRKIIGVLFDPRTMPSVDVDTEINEWDLVDEDIPGAIRQLHGIYAEGPSMEPIAQSGQTVLVSEAQAPEEATLSKGSLAVTETDVAEVGHSVKRVFAHGDKYILVSPNPVQSFDPILIGKTDIKRFWPVRGILFRIEEESDEDSGDLES